MDKIDFKRVAASLLNQCPGLLHSWFPNGKLEGNEFRIGNISGEPGDSLAVNIRSGIWKDFASDMGGADLISLYAAKEGIKMGKAAMALDNGETMIPVKKKEKEELPLEVVPEGTELPPKHYKYGSCSNYWEYRGRLGELLGITCRFDFSDGKKDVLPARWINGKWEWKSFPKPRILYGLERVRGLPLVVVEGEKKAVALKRLLPNHDVIGWPGGAQAAKFADWSLLDGIEDITIWPDNDTPGRKAAAVIRKILGRGYVIENTGEDGWDAADAEKEGWDTQRTLDYIRQPEIALEEIAFPDEEPERFFKVLGYDGDEFYFYSYQSKQVHGISRGSLTNSASLLQLAPLEWWARNGYTTDKDNIKTTHAVNMLISSCFRAGLFNPNCCRGAGAWEDKGRSILHVGDKLIVDGREVELSDFDSRYVYERRHSTGIEYGAALGTKDAHRLLEMCKLIRWEDSISAELLAGWIVIAPICGALLHRPHLYIIGPATSGKSWVIENIIQAILGKTAFVTSSKTTAAGIRQNMRSDALPVIFDEAEAEQMSDRLRLQEIFDLARVSFNGDAAPIHKGTADQSGRSYQPRSCFCFGSINQSMTKNPDETRTSILKLRPPSKDASFERENFLKLEKMATETITREWRGGLLSRTVSLIPVIKENTKIFSDAASNYFSSRRQGDQLGPILAGLYSLFSTGIVETDAALGFISRQQWTQQREVIDDSSHLRLWRFLMENVIEFDSMGAGQKKATVAELISVLNGEPDPVCGLAAAGRALRNAGFLLEDGMILVSNVSLWIETRLKNTEWPGKWANSLKCLEGAVASKSPKRFVTVSQYVAVPVGMK